MKPPTFFVVPALSVLLTVGVTVAAAQRPTSTRGRAVIPARPVVTSRLSLQIAAGVVTLDAFNVTVDEVLARWSQTTGMTIVSHNGRGSDVPLTLRLDRVDERTALGEVLRDVSGYIMGERRDPETGVVTIDRLILLPDSAAQPGPRLDTASEAAPARPIELAPVVQR